jgi:hypothetical protein
MLQNRLDPLGNIIRTKARGSWMGNRGGVLHDERQHIVRPYKSKAWLTCLLQFKGRQRQVMTPKRYTELFSFDEATAFAAGHRPCAECRRADFNRFREHWVMGNPEYGFTSKVLIGEIDNILHQERIDKHNQKVIYKEKIMNLPNGIFVLLGDEPYLVVNDELYQWTPFGYKVRLPVPTVRSNKLSVLTPRSVVNAFRAGYLPQMKIDPVYPLAIVS